MHTTAIHPEFGATLTDIDVKTPDHEEAIDLAINWHSFLHFPGQELDDDDLLAFTRQFGVLEEEHVSYYSTGKITYIGLVGNILPNGDRITPKRAHAMTGNQMWHSDSSFREIPALYSILYAYEVPEEGGETEFVSGRAAYRRLDQETRDKIDGLVGIHDYIYSRTKVGEDAVNEGQRKFMHPVRQKLVRTNPVTGEKNLYLGSHVRTIDGWEEDEARPLIESLTAETTRPESIYRHRWQPGDLVMWDNRCMLHRGCGYDAARYRRRMHQTRVRGLGPSLAED